MTGTVLARQARRLSLRRARIREEVLDTLWFLPLCCAVLAWIAGRLALGIDLDGGLTAAGSGLNDDREAYANVASTVAAAMFTFLGVVFATTLVAVQLAASQYSPRIVRVFVRSRLTRAALGVFLSTFVFSLVTLFGAESASEPFVPSVMLACLVVLVAATVVFFVAYIHGMVRLLRVQYLLRVTARAAHAPLDDAFPDASAYSTAPPPSPSPSPRPVRNRTPRRGDGAVPRVLQAIDVGGLAEAAAAHGCWVDVRVEVGTHAGPGLVVAEVHGDGLTDDEVRRHLLFGSERTLLQDPGFGFRQLVDTASRALSPAVNDPTTGVQALHRIVDLLELVAGQPDPTGWYTDAAGVVRVRLREVGFERLVRLGLLEILRYGADAPQVTRCVLAVCDELEALVADERREVLAQVRAQCLAAIDDAMPAAFADEARVPDRMGLG